MKYIKLYEDFINEKWSDHRDEWDADSRTTYDKAAEKFARRAIAMRIDGTNITNASKLDTLKSAAVSFAPKGMTAKEFFIAATPNAGLIPKDPSWDALARTNRDKWNEVRAEVATDLWDGKLTESLNEEITLNSPSFKKFVTYLEKISDESNNDWTDLVAKLKAKYAMLDTYSRGTNPAAYVVNFFSITKGKDEYVKKNPSDYVEIGEWYVRPW